MSRGFDGFEIDDFRDSCFGWERDTDRNRRPSSDWNNRLAVSSIREADSGWRATEPISKQTSEGGPCSNVALDPDQSNWGNSLISFPSIDGGFCRIAAAARPPMIQLPTQGDTRVQPSLLHYFFTKY